jgi:hypothetical protein
MAMIPKLLAALSLLHGRRGAKSGGHESIPGLVIFLLFEELQGKV